MAADNTGMMYVVGGTASADFPILDGGGMSGRGDGFVARIDTNAIVNTDSLTHNTYLGGTGDRDDAVSVALDPTDGIWVLGRTNSSDFPVTNNSQITGPRELDPYVTRLSFETVTPNTLYVYDIRFESGHGGKDWRAIFEIRSDSNSDGIADPGDSLLGGVSVEVTFNGKTFAGVTDSDGLFHTDWQKKLSSGAYRAEAVDVALTDYVWDNTLGEDDGDEDGLPDDLLVL